MNFLTHNAIIYTLNHLFKVAGINLTDDNSIDISPDNQLVKVTISQKTVKFIISPLVDILQLLDGIFPLNQIRTADFTNTIPIILDNNKPFAEIAGNVLQINADVISLSFIMLSRYEETIVKQRDEYDRFEFKNSIAAKYNFIDFPIVDEYAIILRKYLKELLPNRNFEIRECKIIPTHDIDFIRRFGSISKSIKTLIGEIIIYKSFKSFFNSLIQCINSFFNYSNDPYLKAIDTFINLSSKYNLISEFYFMGAIHSKFNNGYEVNEKAVIQSIQRIIKNGMLIGIHGGFETYKDYKLLYSEKTAIEKAIGTKLYSVRQHYLRFDINETFNIFEKASINSDSTLCYAEREGFRCGTCYPFHPFDFRNDKEYEVLENPLIVMDGTLSGYRKLNNKIAYETIVRLYMRCKTVGGNFIILWHNDSVSREPKKFKDIYCRFLENYSNDLPIR